MNGGFELNKKIGIIGGGQLGKMMILEAKKMGFYIIVLDPSPDCPCHSISDEHIVAGFDDRDAIVKLAEKSDVVTYELEHIDCDILVLLEARGKKVYPSPASLLTIQNKFTQKTKMRENNIPVHDFCGINTVSDILKAGNGFGYPMLLKTCTGGYDGKGNYLVKSAEGAEEAFYALGGGKLPLMAEKFVPFVMEISAIACRGTDGEMKVYPIAQNTHDDNILIETRVPADISKAVEAEAVSIAKMVLEVFEGVGIICVEMFVLENSRVYVNEVAPRPHNSGHYTIEGCVTSQFQQHIRAITELPLGDVSLISPVVMRNLLGEAGYSGTVRVLGVRDALKIDGVRLHIYGKAETKPKRKMGHITATAETVGQAAEKAKQAHGFIKIISDNGNTDV